MGWWNVGKTKGIMVGDEPADLVTRLLREMSDNLEEQNKPKPSLGELLRVLRDVIGERGEDYFHENEARMETDRYFRMIDSASSDILSNETDARGIREAIEEIISGVVQVYAEQIERKPSVAEMLANFVLVLSPHPEQYLRDAQGLDTLRDTIILA